KLISYSLMYMSEEEQLNASRQFLATMAQRRTIRAYSSQPVPYELIENAIRAASDEVMVHFS
ncbi:MAG: hypothetical protein M3Y76_03430, partial [Chloroflexota bacterium]|nr:hypothetical protein [Chloroflexota bacterium]